MFFPTHHGSTTRAVTPPLCAHIFVSILRTKRRGHDTDYKQQLIETCMIMCMPQWRLHSQWPMQWTLPVSDHPKRQPTGLLLCQPSVTGQRH